jgi:chromosome segregation ATPase
MYDRTKSKEAINKKIAEENEAITGWEPQKTKRLEGKKDADTSDLDKKIEDEKERIAGKELIRDQFVENSKPVTEMDKEIAGENEELDREVTELKRLRGLERKVIKDIEAQQRKVDKLRAKIDGKGIAKAALVDA